MHIVLRGFENNVSCKELSSEMSALELFEQVAAETGLELGSFNMICNGVEISEEMTLGENGLTDGAIVDLGLEVDGGKKKKKKKVHKTDKKKKHKHINSKLRILSYYNIKNDGTVEATRLKSPHTGEGQVMYMANHWNRHYCGRSHLSLIKEKPDVQKKKVVVKVAEVKADAKGKAPAKGGKPAKKK